MIHISKVTNAPRVEWGQEIGLYFCFIQGIYNFYLFSRDIERLILTRHRSRFGIRVGTDLEKTFSVSKKVLKRKKSEFSSARMKI